MAFNLNPFGGRPRFGNFNNEAEEAFGGMTGTSTPYAINGVRVNPQGQPFRNAPDYGGRTPTTLSGTRHLGDSGVPGGSNNFNFSDNIQRILDDIFAQKEKDEQYNTNQINSAVGTLTGPGGLTSKISGFFDPIIKETKSSIPLNPFTDVMKQKLYAQIEDETNKEVEAMIKEASASLAGRGYGSGGTSGQTQAGGIVAEGVGIKNKGKTDVDVSQLEFNTNSNQFRQQLINQLTGQKAGMISNTTGLAANMKAGNVIDPKASADILSNAFGLQLSEENQKEMMAFLETLEPSMFEKLVQTVPGLLQIMNPSMQGVTAGADMLIDAIF